MNPRWVAAQYLLSVIYHGCSLNDITADIDSTYGNDAALIKDICYGSIRWHFAISAILEQLLVKPMKTKDKDVECLIRVGIYQLNYQYTPAHAAVNETVKASKKLEKKWTKSLINGVLRTYIRKKPIIDADIKKKQEAIHGHPQWIIDSLYQAWPDQAEQLMQANMERAPMTLRVNPLVNTTEAYLEKLAQADIQAEPSTIAKHAIILDKPVPVTKLPDFQQGACSVQDLSAQLAASLLVCEKGMRVLDACAAPGGKTCHLLESYQAIELDALDIHPQRLKKIRQNLSRLALSAKIIGADVLEMLHWHDGTLYDRILLDAPCSATGVIRRHPDVKVLRQANDIKALVKQQHKMLEILWDVLKPGGKLLYATCSIFPEENELQIERFIKNNKDATIIPIQAEWGIPLSHGRQILTSKNMDGFYYALIEKKE